MLNKHWTGLNQGLPTLYIQIDDRIAMLDRSQNRILLNRFDAVFLGPDFQDSHKVTVELEPGRMEVLEGFTQDAGIVNLYRGWLNA